MNKAAVLIVAAAVLVGGAIFLVAGNKDGEGPVAGSQNNVTTLEGKQVIEISAKGGYLPGNTVAKANIPTVLKIKTNGTFDCSSALTIPSLDYRTNLPPSGETLVEVPPQKEGSTLRGLCSMGMYSFQVAFK